MNCDREVWVFYYVPERATRSVSSRPTAANLRWSMVRLLRGLGRRLLAAVRLAVVPSRRPSGTRHRGPPDCMRAWEQTRVSNEGDVRRACDHACWIKERHEVKGWCDRSTAGAMWTLPYGPYPHLVLARLCLLRLLIDMEPRASPLYNLQHTSGNDAVDLCTINVHSIAIVRMRLNNFAPTVFELLMQTRAYMS